jgi:hypothetical protein
MITIGLIFAISSIMVREGVPELSESSKRKLALVAERNAAMVAMEEKKRMRKLNEEEGGFMGYTRRRHRYLGENAHKEVSDKFSAFGIWSTALIYFAFWVFLMFPNWILPFGRPGIALVGGLSMVLWRYILQSFGHGPFFDAEKVIIMEPPVPSVWSHAYHYLHRKDGTRRLVRQVAGLSG